MGDSSSSDSSWKKLVMTKSKDQWLYDEKSDTNNKSSAANTNNASFDYFGPGPLSCVKTELEDEEKDQWNTGNFGRSPEFADDSNPLATSSTHKRSESADQRAARLAKMSAYAAHRLANESPEKRASRLKRMSDYAAKRLANESSTQRAKRLARMSAYAAKRLAQETPEQRKERLARMSAYAARRHAMKKSSANTSKGDSDVQ